MLMSTGKTRVAAGPGVLQAAHLVLSKRLQRLKVTLDGGNAKDGIAILVHRTRRSERQPATLLRQLFSEPQ